MVRQDGIGPAEFFADEVFHPREHFQGEESPQPPAVQGEDAAGGEFRVHRRVREI